MLSSTHLFFGLCIPSRLAIAYITSKCISTPCLLAFSGIAIAQAVAWLLIFTRVFPRDIGIETFGKRIWWNNLRPVHAVLHLLFAFTSLYSVFYPTTGNSSFDFNYASLWLVLDICMGGIARVLHSYGKVF